jgi:hypothetical protein
MRIFLYFSVIIGFLAGIGIFGAARSAIHEILGTLMIGFSFMLLALTAILGELVKLNAKWQNGQQKVGD